MAELHHECGIAAVHYFGSAKRLPVDDTVKSQHASRLIPQMLVDIQNRGQLAAGMTTYRPDRKRLLLTHKNVGSVNEVFRMSREAKYKRIMQDHKGPAAIGHVRYATCGRDDPSYAQPFEREHLQKTKWFSFGFNGQLANYKELRQQITEEGDFHLSRETDTETLMHLISGILSRDPSIGLTELLAQLAPQLDGAYNIVFLNSLGDMFVSRDPNGFRPLSYAVRDGFFAAASESVALENIGFEPEEIQDLPAGHAVIIEDNELRIERYAPTLRLSHCFFEWIYFANVCSRLDDQSVYLTRKKLGEELAELELRSEPEFDPTDAIVVPVPDTARSAAEGMAFSLGVPCLEGLMRHRALGRTFIESKDRQAKAKRKYIPLQDVLAGKRVFLVDDTIVRSTTMKVLIEQIRKRGAKEIHIRVACPPIMAPCFYGIDMPDVGDLFAPTLANIGEPLTPEIEMKMARHFDADSLHYLPLESIVRALGKPANELCQACLNGEYPTPAGQQLYDLSLSYSQSSSCNGSHRLVEGEPALPPARL